MDYSSIKQISLLYLAVGLACAPTPGLGMPSDTDGEPMAMEETTEGDPQEIGTTGDFPASATDTTTGPDPSDEGGSSGEIGGEDSSSEGTSDEDTADDGESDVECVDDPYEDNDSIGFPAAWDGTALDAVSCGSDLDVFQVWPELPAQSFSMKQAVGSTGQGEPYANLVFELYCGQALCAFDASTAEIKRVDASECGCPEDERWFLRVYAGEPANPPQGTIYALLEP